MAKKKARLPEHIRKIFAEYGRMSSGPSLGGKARASKLSPERRREIAKKALDARWAKVRAAKAKHTKKSPPKP
jgi:hypothetical protein